MRLIRLFLWKSTRFTSFFPDSHKYYLGVFHRHNDETPTAANSLYSRIFDTIRITDLREGGNVVGGNYQKGLYEQLMEVMAKVDSLESESRKDHREINRLSNEVKRLDRENTSLRDKVTSLTGANTALLQKCAELSEENELLRNDNERMKRILNNDSSNTSIPPSKDGGRPANTYNGRKPSGKKKGAQPGHKGTGLSKADVERNIRNGSFDHKIKTIGDARDGNPYVTRYKLDLDIRTTATEYRIYADKEGKFLIPDDLKGDVVYGDSIKSIIAFLYSEGVVSNDRIAAFVNSISGDLLRVSTGTVYNTCGSFSAKCTEVCDKIEDDLLNSHEICTDGTPVSTDGRQTYIRNFSTERSILYVSSEKKDLETLRTFSVLRKFTGIFTHDHETALYHFGTGHGECNVHLLRYFLKNTEETGNLWSHDFSMFLEGLNEARNRLKASGAPSFSQEQLERYSARYDALVERGFRENASTKGKIARAEEKTLLNRLRKYKENHLLFLYDFNVHYSNNMSEKDLRICKNRQKMAGGFRTASGREMYCRIMSFIETMKRRKINLYQGIMDLMAGRPVLQ